MRQHPIPQNILDVEFKLFTRFTLKEFAYLAIGIGFGGLMIYLTVSHFIPGIVGIPICLLSSGAGIFLGLVPINEQDADVFIKNYVTAINNPTQRVWLNKEMKEERTKPTVNPSEENGKKIIGGNIAAPVVEGPVENTFKQTASVQQETIAQPTPIAPNILTITDDNRGNYQFNIKSLAQLPGNINIWLHNSAMQPIPNVIAYMKDQNNKVVYANKTGNTGYFLTNKIWDPGIYNIDFEHSQYKFPRVQLIITDNTNKLPLKIKAI